MLKFFRTSYLIVFFLLLIHFIILLKIQFIAWPEMLSYPYLLSKGYQLYTDIINPYTPLLSLVLLFWYKIFGLSLLSLKSITYLNILICDILLFWVIKKNFNDKYASGTLLIYIFLQPVFEGNGLWFDLALTPLFIFLYYLLIKISQFNNRNVTGGYLCLTGLLLGISFMVKQTSAFVFISVLIFFSLLIKKFKLNFVNLLIYLGTFSLPIIVISLYIFNQGNPGDYLYWVFQYPYFHLRSSGFAQYPTLKQLSVLFVVALPVIYSLIKFRSDKRIFTLLFLLIPLVGFSFPRFAYFHLQPVIPFISLIIALFIDKTVKNRPLFVKTYMLLLLIIIIYFLGKGFGLEPRFYDKQTIRTAFLLHDILPEQEKVYFYNLSSQYFVIADLLPVKPWVDTFPWYLETNFLQDKIIEGIKTQKIHHIIHKQFGHEGSYIAGSYKPVKIDEYINSNFVYSKKLTDDLWLLTKKDN